MYNANALLTRVTAVRMYVCYVQINASYLLLTYPVKVQRSDIVTGDSYLYTYHQLQTAHALGPCDVFKHASSSKHVARIRLWHHLAVTSHM